ncbi:MAG: hypothetical protein AAGH72_04580 [Verrucomicrobiota bacterium]
MMSEEGVPPLAAEVAPEQNKNKWLWGCGIGCLGLIVIGILATATAVWFALSFVDDLEQELIALGLEKQSGQFIKVEETVTSPTYYKGQVIMIRNGSDVPIGFLCQMAELRGEFHEPVTFRGQIVTIHADAVLHQGIDVKAQIVERLGEVKGEITGQYQIITETASLDYSQFEEMMP